MEGRFIFPTSRATIVIYARTGCIVSCDVRVFGAVTSRSKKFLLLKMAATIVGKTLLKKNVTTFPDEEISFFPHKKVFHQFLLVHIRIWFQILP